MIQVLASVCFDQERHKSAIGLLSGGRKMKLALARAILFKADIRLLDEPTDHLDVVNISWLENYLTGLTHCKSIIASHDSGFLNSTITDVLHLNCFKIRRYRSNLESIRQGCSRGHVANELIWEMLCTALTDMLTSMPRLHMQLTCGPPHTYYGSVALAIVAVAVGSDTTQIWTAARSHGIPYVAAPTGAEFVMFGVETMHIARRVSARRCASATPSRPSTRS